MFKVLLAMPVVAMASANSVTTRCGLTFIHARDRCGPTCQTDTDCTIAGETCFADLGVHCYNSRCGTDWLDASGKCSSPCGPTVNGGAPCAASGESCISDLPSCTAGGDRAPMAPSCVSTRAYVTDNFCTNVACELIYDSYCSPVQGAISATGLMLTTTSCSPYATLDETWADVALKFDVTAAELKLANPSLNSMVEIPGSALRRTIVEIPGDCQAARIEVNWVPNDAPTAAPNAAPSADAPTGADAPTDAAAPTDALDGEGSSATSVQMVWPSVVMAGVLVLSV